jgi:hypothetical protein
MKAPAVFLMAGLFGCSRQEPPPPVPDSNLVAVPPAPTPAGWTVRYDGIGPVRVGASVAELEATLGTRLPRRDSLDPRCDYLRNPTLVPGVWFMIVQGRVARIDIDSAGPATAEGVRVGDDTTRAMSTYAPRLEVSPHKYTDGKYLTVTPATPADSGFRLIFETRGGKITHIRAGRLPEVGWVESCS